MGPGFTVAPPPPPNYGHAVLSPPMQLTSMATFCLLDNRTLSSYVRVLLIPSPQNITNASTKCSSDFVNPARGLSTNCTQPEKRKQDLGHQTEHPPM